MAQNISLMGADYESVPAVVLPKTGGGTAQFTDVSDSTAEASDVAEGKYFYTANGIKTEGTSQGGGTPIVYGIEDTEINDESRVTATIADNVIINMSTVAANAQFYFRLKKPIDVSNGDVIGIKFSNKTGSTGYSNIRMLTVPYGAMDLLGNTAITNNKLLTRTESTYPNYQIIAIGFGPRHTAVWNNVNATIHMYLNGDELF